MYLDRKGPVKMGIKDITWNTYLHRALAMQGSAPAGREVARASR